MSKPIFVIRVPEQTTRDIIHDMQQGIEKKIPDWYILVVLSSVDSPQFEAFHVNNLEDIEFERLKQLVTDYLQTA